MKTIQYICIVALVLGFTGIYAQDFPEKIDTLSEDTLEGYIYTYMQVAPDSELISLDKEIEDLKEHIKFVKDSIYRERRALKKEIELLEVYYDSLSHDQTITLNEFWPIEGKKSKKYRPIIDSLKKRLDYFVHELDTVIPVKEKTLKERRKKINQRNKYVADKEEEFKKLDEKLRSEKVSIKSLSDYAVRHYSKNFDSDLYSKATGNKEIILLKYSSRPIR